MRVTKNNGWKVASNIVGYGGVMICCLAALAYVILHIVDPSLEIIGPFTTTNLYYIAAAAAAFIVIAVVLRLIGISAAKKAVNVEINEAVEEIVEEVVEDLGEDLAVEEVVEEEEPVVEVEEDTVDPTCEKCAAIRAKLTMTPETKEKVVATVKKSIPVIVAVVATAAVSTAINRAANEKKKARARKTLLDFFY